MAQKEENLNPVYVVRNKLGLSHEEMAERYDVSKSTLLRTEQGLYARIPPEILRHLKSDHPSPWNIPIDYNSAQISQRLRNRYLLREVRDIKFDAYSKTHPFIEYREACGITSRLEFCRLFCMHHSTLKRYEDAISLNTPQYLLDILNYLGVDWGLLEERYHLWRWQFKKVG